jgi:hypothetical protein
MTVDQSAVAEDLGNIVSLEHVNLTVPDQILATWFYIVGMGFTRDPYLNVTPNNMWANVGEQQFHLPTRGPQSFPGQIGIVLPDLEHLKERLKAVEEPLSGTQFAWSAKRDHVAVTCPWGNQFRCYAPRAEFGQMQLGIPYVEFDVKSGTADGIARFYREVLKAPATVSREKGARVASVVAGRGQQIRFRETNEKLPEYPGHHIAVYVADFSDPYAFFDEKGIIMEGLRNHQFRFKRIVDLDNGELLTELEHEVRSLQHPMVGRYMVNRNPAQTQAGYVRGRDAA